MQVLAKNMPAILRYFSLNLEGPEAFWQDKPLYVCSMSHYRQVISGVVVVNGFCVYCVDTYVVV